MGRSNRQTDKRTGCSVAEYLPTVGAGIMVALENTQQTRTSLQNLLVVLSSKSLDGCEDINGDARTYSTASQWRN